MKEYDQKSWADLRLISTGATGIGATATHIIQERVCTCGARVTLTLPLPERMTEAQSDMLSMAANMAQATRKA